MSYPSQFRRKAFHPSFIGHGPSTAPVLIASDTFNRANVASPPGPTDGNGTEDPITPTAQAGTWGISTNQLFPFALAAGPLPARITWETHAADITMNITLATLDANGAGVLFRWVDASNYWLLLGSTSTLSLSKVVAGSSTNVSGFIGVLGSGYTIQVTANGSAISVVTNGNLIYSTSDSTHATATKHGLQSQGTSQRWDNLSFYTA